MRCKPEVEVNQMKAWTLVSIRIPGNSPLYQLINTRITSFYEPVQLFLHDVKQ